MKNGSISFIVWCASFEYLKSDREVNEEKLLIAWFDLSFIKAASLSGQSKTFNPVSKQCTEVICWHIRDLWPCHSCPTAVSGIVTFCLCHIMKAWRINRRAAAHPKAEDPWDQHYFVPLSFVIWMTFVTEPKEVSNKIRRNLDHQPNDFSIEKDEPFGTFQ